MNRHRNIHKYWGESLNYLEAPHVPLMLAGRFKREVGESYSVNPWLISQRLE
jgi:hypothetical protein